MLCSAAAEPQQQYAFSERGAGQHGLRGAFYGCRSSCQTIPGSGRPGKPVLMESATPAASAAMAIRDTMAVYEPKATMRSKGYTQTKKAARHETKRIDSQRRLTSGTKGTNLVGRGACRG